MACAPRSEPRPVRPGRGHANQLPQFRGCQIEAECRMLGFSHSPASSCSQARPQWRAFGCLGFWVGRLLSARRIHHRVTGEPARGRRVAPRAKWNRAKPCARANCRGDRAADRGLARPGTISWHWRRLGIAARRRLRPRRRTLLSPTLLDRQYCRAPPRRSSPSSPPRCAVDGEIVVTTAEQRVSLLVGRRDRRSSGDVGYATPLLPVSPALPFSRPLCLHEHTTPNGRVLQSQQRDPRRSGADDHPRSSALRRKANPSARVLVLGFASPETGTAESNKALAQARAQTVADGLVAAGVPQARIHVEPWGAIAYGLTPTESRRVEIVVGQ